MGERICCICGKRFSGWGNNPQPVCKDEYARCCDTCNNEEVIPARVRLYEKEKNNGIYKKANRQYEQ